MKTRVMSDGKESRGWRRGVLADLVGYHLRRAQVAVFADFAASVGKGGWTPGRFGVLALIEANPGLNQSELGALMGVDRSTAALVVERLVRDGMVLRRAVPGDRRAYALALSRAGARRFMALIPIIRGHEARMLAALSARERRGVIDLLSRIASSGGLDRRNRKPGKAR